MGEDRTIKEGDTKRRWILSIRTTSVSRERLQDAARENDRSLSEEVQSRLEWSFQKDDTFGGSLNAAFFGILGSHVRFAEEKSGKSWLADYDTWKAVKNVIIRELDARAPAQPRHRQKSDHDDETQDVR